MAKRPGGKDNVRNSLKRMRGALLFVGIFSALVNLLMLTGPLFMLQIYDRVLASGSVPTLTVLLGLVVALFAMLGLFDFLRQRILSRAAHAMDNRLSPKAYRAWMIRALGGNAPGYKPIQDISALRSFFCSPTILAIFDLPWFPIYLGVVFFLHLKLGLLALAGASTVVVLALINEFSTSRSASLAAQKDIVESRFAEQSQAGSDALLSMGMLENALTRWRGLRNDALGEMQTASERSEAITAASKAFRLLMQSAILAMGAYLAIGQEITPGMIVAASIIAGRALAPIDQVIGGWRMIKRARISQKRLREYLEGDVDPAKLMQLPEPKAILSIEDLVKYAPATKTASGKPILRGINFSLEPGDGLGVIGPSASGKSSLAKLIVGLWMPDTGVVRIDGATFDQWPPDAIGPYIGYLPQLVTLFPGTIGQNIARFDPDAQHQDIVEAADLAGVHEMILRFADGYDTQVDAAISPLTGGQTQRIGIARAIFKKPRLIVLDEPNSNLDAEGDASLARTLRAMRDSGSIVVVMAHRPSAIAAVDKVLVLADGDMVEFGPKTEVLRKVTRAA